MLVMTDAFSKYVEIFATPNKEAETVSLAIFNRWICRFGCPLEIVSDGGKEFVNKIEKNEDPLSVPGIWGYDSSGKIMENKIHTQKK